MSEFSEPAVSQRNETTAYRFLDTLSYIRVAKNETAGQCSVVEMHLREGHAPPMHVHESADETIHVLDGAVTAHTAEAAHSVPAGETVVLPQSEQHTLVANEQSVILSSTTPAGFDEFVTAVGEPAEDKTIPTNPPSEEAIGQINALASEYDIKIVGPPPVDS